MPGGAPLNLRSFLWRGENVFPDSEIVSRTHQGIHRYTIAEYAERVRKLASALEQAGIERGDRVGTFAWNNHWHQEAYYGVACMGAQVHMINLLLPDEHIQHIVADAEDEMLIVDPVMLEKLEAAYDEEAFASVEQYIVMGDTVPETSLEPVVDYESFIADGDPDYSFPQLPEDQPAGMCYTSGTTGKPKGVEYTQKMYWTQVMSLMTSQAGIKTDDVELTYVPMFHVSGWCRPFTTIAAGAKTVLPGPNPSAEDLAKLIEEEDVTVSAAVPTVFMDLLEYARESDVDFSSVRYFTSGGSATPRSLMEDYKQEFDVDLISGYGMTETSPVTHAYEPKPGMTDLPEEELFDLRSHSAGLPIAGLEFKVVNTDGEEVPWDGESLGELWMRGPWVTQEYYNAPDATEQAVTDDGWFKTGDIVRVSPEGYVDVVDRMDDLVKSGGEWIASVEVENAVMGHDEVVEAAVVPVPHERWDERPAAFVVTRDAVSDEAALRREIKDLVAESYPSWWVPDAIRLVDEIPKGATGKFSKQTLRDEYVDESIIETVAENAPAT
ncbi:long-chain-fatty-acid--CoA ligase [Haloarcula rubripromontorii]|uniref:Fatty-acid--CoA ligase n=1 Tax=Haloarcula rubripromontorii TaxID=1705562 RepID=A0A0M9AK27_9EURY|nr:long-chain-fatty-acid--CoA ligase [Haloarcula rubripromontorii]KOX93667.1 fatty-acid--CoA ligase [Haloarcula rubripromontorii]